MERTAATSGSDERAQREELERVQVELRAARASLATVEEDTRRAEAELTASLAEVEVRRSSAAARLEALAAEKDTLKARRKTLKALLEDKRKEQAVLDHGEVMRDEYVEWAPETRWDRQARRNPPTGKELLITIAITLLGVGLLYGLAFLTGK